MKILVTNDDGIYSPGIAALAKVASRFGEVRVVAPDAPLDDAVLKHVEADLDLPPSIMGRRGLALALPAAYLLVTGTRRSGSA